MGSETAVAKLTEAELKKLVTASILAFEHDEGDYLEHQHRQLARKYGLNEERIAWLWHNAADQARQNLATMRTRFGEVAGRFEALRPKIDEAKRKLAEPKQVEPATKPAPSYRRYENVGSSFILPAPQPAAEEAESGNREAEPNAGVVPTGFRQSPTIAPAVADEGVLCLDPAAPFDNAQKLVSLRAWHPGERIRTWQFWQRSFWQWSGTHWCEVDDDTVRASIWHELDRRRESLKGWQTRKIQTQNSDVNALVDALEAAVNLPTSEENAMPGWFGQRGRPDGDLRELVVCKNRGLTFQLPGSCHTRQGSGAQCTRHCLRSSS